MSANASASPEVRARVNTRYRGYSLLSDYFPLTLNNGAAVKGVAAECSRCGIRLSSTMFRGEVRETVANCFRVTAIGWCTDCELLTPFLFHIVPQGSDGYELVPLDFRGWPENYEPSIVSFRQPGQFECVEVELPCDTEPSSNTG